MPNDTQRIEIITGRERRRRYTAHEKVRFVEETMQPGMTVSAVARIHGLSPSLLFGWRRRMAEGGQVAVQADDEVVAAGRMRELEARVRDLERLLGRKTLEVEVLKEALAAAGRPVRAHEGRVIAAASNQRWSSDGLEIGCWNGEVVRVAFAIDTHDREVIAWVASTGGVTGQMVRDLMLTCVEARFGILRATHPVQWLADNGSAYTAAETLSFAAALNLVPRFTPVRSPESNGVSEAFVKTLKRDYARVQPRPDANTVLARIGAWITDYNEHHPHRGLGMRSPREFIRAQLQPAPCPV